MLKNLGILSVFFTFLQCVTVNCLDNGFTTNFRLVDDKVFSTSNNESFILNTFENSSTNICEIRCIADNKCSGIYENNQSVYYCNTLSNLGNLQNSDENEYSYVKVINYSNTLNKNSTLVIYLTNMINNKLDLNNINSTVYIDINHNNLNDDNYSINFTQNDYVKYFRNLHAGVYEIRQTITTPGCHQGFPGLNGSYLDVYSNGYVSHVINYYHDGHSGFNDFENIGNPHGGYVDSNTLYYNGNFSFLLGNNNNTYLSFYPGDNITLHFNNDLVFDSDGVDILFNIYNNTNTNNYASVFGGPSLDNMGFIDYLNYSYFEFDLANYNVDLPIRYLKLQFYGDESVNFNLKNILFNKIRRYIGNNENVYHVKLNENSTNYVFIINYCGNLSCNNYCDFNLYNNADYYSCIHGCLMFERYHYCDCETSQFKETIFNYYGYQYNPNYCNFACEYSFDEYLGPNYTVIMNTRISDHSALAINFNNRDLLDILIDECDENYECIGISLGDETGYISNETSDNSFESNHSFISILRNLVPETNTMTTSQTTSQTTTLSTTPIITNILNNNGNGSKEENSFNYYYIIIIVSILLVLILVGFTLYKVQQNNSKVSVSETHNPPSFSNPIYSTEPYSSNINDYDDVFGEPNDNDVSVLYQDVIIRETSVSEIDYLDVHPQTPSPIYYTQENTNL